MIQIFLSKVKKAFIFIAVILCIIFAVFLYFKYQSPKGEKRLIIGSEFKKTSNRNLPDNFLSAGKEECYDRRYLRNVILLENLVNDFYSGSDVSGKLIKLKGVDLSDPYLKDCISYLDRVINKSNGKNLHIDYLQQSFVKTKSQIIRQYCRNKYVKYHLSMITNLFCLYKHGAAAIVAGGVEGALENAHLQLRNGNVKEAFTFLSAVGEDYLFEAKQWLEDAEHYLEVTSMLNEMLIYIKTEKYSSKFTKECRK